jgi:hypothetical protein
MRLVPLHSGNSVRIRAYQHILYLPNTSQKEILILSNKFQGGHTFFKWKILIFEPTEFTTYTARVVRTRVK